MTKITIDDKKEVLANGSYFVDNEFSKISFSADGEELIFEIIFVEDKEKERVVELFKNPGSKVFNLKITFYNVDKFLAQGGVASLGPIVVASDIEKKIDIYAKIVISKIDNDMKNIDYVFYKLVSDAEDQKDV